MSPVPSPPLIPSSSRGNPSVCLTEITSTPSIWKGQEEETELLGTSCFFWVFYFFLFPAHKHRAALQTPSATSFSSLLSSSPGLLSQGSSSAFWAGEALLQSQCGARALVWL